MLAQHLVNFAGANALVLAARAPILPSIPGRLAAAPASAEAATRIGPGHETRGVA